MKKADTFKLSVMLAMVIAVFFASFLIGRYPVSPDIVFTILVSKILHLPQTWPETMEKVVMNVRLPRIIAAMLVGSALAASGAAYQNLFRNPLVDPKLLGVSFGAGFGAALGIILHLSWLWVQVGAFGGGLLAVTCSMLISTYFGKSITVLVVGGMVVSYFFQALIYALQYVADPNDTLPTIVFWLMGGFNKVSMGDFKWAFPLIALPTAILYAIRWHINILGIGEEEAHTLGVNVKWVRGIVIVCATLMTAAAVSISGIIGWVGLVIPHIARMVMGTNFSRILPASLLMGGVYLLIIDNLSRSIISIEIPVGILTAVIGAPFFVFLLARTRANKRRL
ncbi:MAG TPA: iron ABC transporter permease [Negativicutes bacterium]|jgi:iron complex transport system permease protein